MMSRMRFLKEFQERLAKFELEVHPDKTRLIAFGREAWRNRKRSGQAKLETFTFLGFTHYCGENSKGYFQDRDTRIQPGLQRFYGFDKRDFGLYLDSSAMEPL